MKTRLFSTFFALMVMGVAAIAQNISWVVKPGIYDRITPCGTKLYEVTSGNRVGVIDDAGREIVPLECREITGFHEGYALALADEGGQRRVLGILSADGDYAYVGDGRYYTIERQEFVSEGFLTVRDGSGNAGYMNTRGVVEHIFRDANLVAPFCEGYAAVWIADDYHLLDRRFREVEIVLTTNSELEGGTNVYKGEAVVWAGGKSYKYNVATGDCRKYRCKNEDLDYLFCYSELTGRPQVVSHDVFNMPTSLVKPDMRNGKYGYSRNGVSLLSCQLEKASEVYGEVAIVSLGGKTGMLRMLPYDGSFGVATSTPEFEYWKGEAKELKHSFSVTLPAGWQDADLDVRVTNGDGARVAVEGKDGVYTFSTQELTGQVAYQVEIGYEGLKLWDGQFSCNYTSKKRPVAVVDDRRPDPVPVSQYPLSVSVQMKNTMADKNGRCYVVATISNPNGKDVSTNVTFSGSELLNKSSHSVKVPAKGSLTVSTFFTVKKVAKGQSVTVTCSAGGRASLTNLTLRPQK